MLSEALGTAPQSPHGAASEAYVLSVIHSASQGTKVFVGMWVGCRGEVLCCVNPRQVSVAASVTWCQLAMQSGKPLIVPVTQELLESHEPFVEAASAEGTVKFCSEPWSKKALSIG